MDEIAKGFEKLSDIENYKQINEDFESGKTFLIDYYKKIGCNKFGIPLTKCYPDVTGQTTYKSRLDKGLIKELKYENPQYLPNSSHLVGGSMCPRPLSIPLFGQEKSEKIIDEVKKEEIFNFLRNQKTFDLEKPMKDNKALPSYFCVKLAIDSPKTRKHLINLFDEHIQLKKKEYRNDPKYYSKDSTIRGLTDYKNFLKNNLYKNLFNGKIIPYSKQKDINNKFKIIKKLIKKEGWNKMHLERQNINHDAYTKLYKIKGVGDKNNKFKKNFSSTNFFNDLKIEEKINITSEENNNERKNKQFYPIKIKHDKNQKILNALNSPREKGKENKNRFRYTKKKSRQILYDSNILNDQSKKNFNYSSYQSNFNKSMNKFGSTVTTCFNYNNESIISKNIFPNVNEIFTPKNFRPFQRSLSNFQSPKNILEKINNEEENNKNEEKKEKINDGDDLIVIDDSQEIKNKKQIIKLNDIQEDCEHENKLLLGYQPPPETDEVDENAKKKEPKYVSPITVYKKEIEMFKKVNPIEYEKELKKKMFDDKMLLKKLQNRKIYERIKIKK